MIVEEAKTIKEYLLILRFLKSTDGIITIREAVMAIKKVMTFALSVAINIKPKIMGNTWKSIANGCNVETFSFAYAVLLKKYVTYNAAEASINIPQSKYVMFSNGSWKSSTQKNTIKVSKTTCAVLLKSVCRLFPTALFSTTFLDTTIQREEKIDCMIQIIIHMINIQLTKNFF